ncbi:MAG: flagellar biosynthesis protein FlhB [Phycisphaerales bacterium]|nr:flagellar biosynthesis protein FlhB [Phycisphaerales bacterium]
MADEHGDKTEAPTPRRRNEARQSGQIARSQDLNAAVGLLAAIVALLLFGRHIWTTMVAITQRAIDGSDGQGIDAVLVLTAESFVESFKSIVPLMVFLLFVGLVVTLSQVGLLFTWKPITPNLDKLNPVSGFKRMFSPNSLVHLAQNIMKLIVVGGVAWLSVRPIISEMLLAHTVDFVLTMPLASKLVTHVALRLAAALIVLAILDYLYQRFRHEKQLKMTKEEVKEEMRRMEGDPVIKRRRREVQLKLAAQRIKTAVPKADVVVTNPTHYAVALRYDVEEMVAPKVVAKGADYLAQRIREIAMVSGVPIVQKPELARRLYADVAVGAEIPERFYRAVAEILAYVYELSGKSVRRRAAG